MGDTEWELRQVLHHLLMSLGRLDWDDPPITNAEALAKASVRKCVARAREILDRDLTGQEVGVG